jgi:2-polyprenyl-6-methoxyphenol hydroxylase-like FAD-dependent oxidoreductase
MHDVIVVGTRAAGAATAMLLARSGLDVLAVDRAAFPSDTVSTHQVQVPGGAALRRWGLLDRLDTPAASHATFDQTRIDGPVLRGGFPAVDGVAAVHSPRRTRLDALLVEAARAAGAEVRERFAVDELTFEGGRVTGIRGGGHGGPVVTERAALVVGADGKHSTVARAVSAAAYSEQPAATVACYTYWSGLPVDGGEMHALPRRAVGAWPTDDGLTMTYLAWPSAEFERFRPAVEANAMATLLATGLGERVGAATRAERWRATPDVPNRFRAPSGPGWALVGDAGLVMDPITGQGISHAFRDAEALSRAVVAGLGGAEPLDRALAAYGRERDRATLPMYKFTVDLAGLKPPNPVQRAVMRGIAADPELTSRFFGVFTGSIPVNGLFNPPTLARAALGGFSRGRARRPRPAAVPSGRPSRS